MQDIAVVPTFSMTPRTFDEALGMKGDAEVQLECARKLKR